MRNIICLSIIGLVSTFSTSAIAAGADGFPTPPQYTEFCQLDDSPNATHRFCYDQASRTCQDTVIHESCAGRTIELRREKDVSFRSCLDLARETLGTQEVSIGACNLPSLELPLTE